MKDELIALLREIRPNHGDVGTRDVEVSARQKQIDRAIDILQSSTMVPNLMTAAMINAWSDGTTVTTDEIAYRTHFQEAWRRVLGAAVGVPVLASVPISDESLKRFGKSQYRDGYAQGWHDRGEKEKSE